MASQLFSQAQAQQEREMEEMTDTLKNVCFGYQLSSAVAVVAAAAAAVAVAVAVALQSGGRAHIQDNKEGANNHRSHYLHMSPDTRDAT